MEQELSPTLQDYLKVIFRIEREKKVARPKDIAAAQDVAGSTVTAALQSLAEKGMINYEPYEFITLTEEGRERAEQLVVRHQIVRSFLGDILGLEAERAEQTACDMEHAVDRRALERFVCFLAFIHRYSPAGSDWLEDFRRFTEQGVAGQSCEECVKEYMEALQAAQEE
ncbi:MAG: metal-dependent transcriptional regulator [Candidatus Brocadiia bacterium]